ncbi:restriction endonuclease [Paenibacillus lactis]|uniref:Restriction endonuclease n=2 Tax=Paenibacillus lactis TaxID=228574 RepID=G4HDE8_9BACL|nr:restriction endonuclease [Paenibacillus lactis]EHB66074.1 restriction endonuclease [Paenibacillus lactis 154]MBP1891460.1 hypothetical protein [Paenibacillus lactis]GIO93484.1 hypothetical protein J31TS3_47110 [Paenibacillus lactis]
MINFESMDGVEFERLVYNLFVKLGFRAQITKASGDGGVDIVANYEGLLFNGLYLIQCKRWKAKVGEPELRDLYGTVTSKNALKGILVTTSSFSRQAEEFSRGKNLELIDGPKLNELLRAAEMDNTAFSGVINNTERVGFLQSPMFDSEKYQLLARRIDSDPKMEQPINALINLLMEKVFEIGADARTNGLIDETIARINGYNQIFAAGKTKVMKERRNQTYFYLAAMELANANYGKAYENLLKIEFPLAIGQAMSIQRCFITIAYILGLDTELKRLLMECIKGIRFNNGDTVTHPVLISECTKILQGTMKVHELEIPYPNRQMLKMSDFLGKFRITREMIEEHRDYVRSFGKVD